MIVKDLFDNLQFVVDLPITCPYKSKQAVKNAILAEKGIVSYVVNRNTNYLVRDLNDDDSYKSRQAAKLGVPIVGTDFLDECSKVRKLLNWKKFVPVNEKHFKSNVDDGIVKIPTKIEKPLSKSTFQFSTVKVWPYDPCVPYPRHDRTITKVIVLSGRGKKGTVPFVVLELHVLRSTHVDDLGIPKFSVFDHHGNVDVSSKKVDGEKHCRFFDNVDHALLAYQHLHRLYTSPPHSMVRALHTFDAEVGSDRFYPEEWLPMPRSPDPQVARFVQHIWSEAMVEIDETLKVDLKTVSAENIETAKMLLHEIFKSGSQDRFDHHRELCEVLPYKAFSEVLPYKGFSDARNYFKKCQLLQDMLALQEMNGNSTADRYKALHCHIEPLDAGSEKYLDIRKATDKIQGTNKIVIDAIYKIHRHTERSEYCNTVGNEKLLFTGIDAHEAFATLARGFLPSSVDFSPPLTGVCYSSTVESAMKDAEKSRSKGTRLVIASQVALGNEIANDAKRNVSDTEEFHSIRCIKNTEARMSEFEEKYIITDAKQQKMMFLIECHFLDDVVKDVPVKETETSSTRKQKQMIDDADESITCKNTDLHDYLYTKPAKVNAGLQSSGSKAVPLKSVHVRAKLVDLAAKVVLIQEYVNTSSTTIEAKYVFPLDEKAAVCGFEAFTEGRHFVGRIEEKQAARQEYQDAVDSGRKAFLVEEESPEVFTIKLGTVSPGATVLTKITYVTELDLEGDLIHFRVSGSVAPSQAQDSDDNDVIRVSADDNLKTSVEVSLDMPFPIRIVTSYTHKLILKKTETKAVVAVDENDKLHAGFLQKRDITVCHF